MNRETKVKPSQLIPLDKSGLLSSAQYRASPNCDERPDNVEIEAIIIHAISLPPGEYGGKFVEQFFCNQLDSSAHPYFNEIADVKVSSHFYIHRNGDLVQFVPVFKRAWHAGASCCLGRTAVNDFSIGIELEGCDEDGFENVQYQSLTALCNALITAIPTLSQQNIFGHSDIAPGRKTDPGPGFDWPAFRLALGQKGTQTVSRDRSEMITLTQSLDAWGSDRFDEVFKTEAGSIPTGKLPLQQGLTQSSYVADSGYKLVILKTVESKEGVSVKVGVFYAGLNAGSCCADDPGPLNEQTEYCELLFEIHNPSAETRISILPG